MVNCRSVRNKGPCINYTVTVHSVDILAVTETHIRQEETDSLLHSITPTGFKFCHKPRIHGRGGGVGFFINKAIQFRSVDTPTFSSFENVSIAIGSAAQQLVLTCVYRPPGSCSESFLDQFLNLLEYLSSVSPSFLICGDFNIHVDTSSNDGIKFQNCLESCNITQNVQTATHLHGHILDLVLTPTDASVISNVRVAEFISDHALVLAQLDSVNPPSHKAKVVTFRRYHKIDMDSFRKDLGNSAFIKRPGDTVSGLCEQYLDDLSKLLDKHAPLVTRTFTKQATGWLTPTGWQKPSGDSWNESGVKINLPIIELDFEDRLVAAIHWSTKIRQITSETWSEKMPMTPRSYGRSCILHCTLVLKQYSILMNLRKVLLTGLSLSSVTK